MSATVRRAGVGRARVWPESTDDRFLRSGEEEDLEDLGSKSLRLTEYTRRGRRRCRMAVAGCIAVAGLVMLVLVARTAYEAVGVAGTTGPAGYSDSVENEESKRARQAHAGTASGLFRVEPILVPRPRAVQDGLWMHASDSVAIAHVLLTRFCLRHGSMSHLVAARLSLFRGLSIPTVKSQTASRILWIVLIDETLQADAVQELRDLLAGFDHAAILRFSPARTPIPDPNSAAAGAAGDPSAAFTAEAVISDAPEKVSVERLVALTGMRTVAPESVARALYMSTTLEAGDGLPAKAMAQVQSLAAAMPLSKTNRVYFCWLSSLHWYPNASTGAAREVHAPPSDKSATCVSPGLTLATRDAAASSILSVETGHRRQLRKVKRVKLMETRSQVPVHGWLMQPRGMHWPAANRSMMTNAAGNETGGWVAVVASDGQGGIGDTLEALTARGLLGLNEDEMARASVLLTETEAMIREEVRGHHGGRMGAAGEEEEEGGWNVRSAKGESRRYRGGRYGGGEEDEAMPVLADESEHVLIAEDAQDGQPLSVLELLKLERAHRDASSDSGAQQDTRALDAAARAGAASESGAEQPGAYGNQEFEVLSLAEAQANEADAG